MRDNDVAAAEFQAFAQRAFIDAFRGGTQTFDLGVDTPGGDVLELSVERPGRIRCAGTLELGGVSFPTDRSWPAGEHAAEILIGKSALFQRFDRATSSLPLSVRVLFSTATAASFRLARGTGALLPSGTFVTSDVRIDGGALALATEGHAAAMEQTCAEHDVDEPYALLHREGSQFAVLERGHHWERWRLGDHECVLVRAGLGDGTYPVFEGLDEHGTVCSVIVDFGILGG